MIKHFPITNIDKIIQHYSEKDGVNISYVCTTDLRTSDLPVDIFYRDNPHPKFENRYFGIFYSYNTDNYMICDADVVENLSFGLIEDDNGDLQYSQSQHDYKSFDNGNMIDGGRAYIRSSNSVDIYVIRDGKMVERHLTNADSLV